MYAAPARFDASHRMEADFARDMATWARQLRLDVPDLTDEERHKLQDVADEGRYEWVTLRQMMAIARRARRLEVRGRLELLVRRECSLKNAQPIDVAIALDAETQAEGDANVAARAFERSKCRVSWERFVEKTMVHAQTAQIVLDALLMAGPVLTG
jgi:hypothetical protein